MIIFCTSISCEVICYFLMSICYSKIPIRSVIVLYTIGGIFLNQELKFTRNALYDVFFLKKEHCKCISIVSKIICQFHVTILYCMVITIRSIIVLYTYNGIFLNQEFSDVQVTPKCCKVKWRAKKKWHLTAISDSWYTAFKISINMTEDFSLKALVLGTITTDASAESRKLFGL